MGGPKTMNDFVVPNRIQELGIKVIIVDGI